jgi:hypothetical protein
MLPSWLKSGAPSDLGASTRVHLFDVPAGPPAPTLPSGPPSILRQVILPRSGPSGFGTAPVLGGLAGLIEANPGTFPYVGNGGGVEMWSSAPTRDAYRLTTSPASALDALSQGDTPLLFPEDADVPDLRTVMETIERQWAAPGGEPMFIGSPGGGGFAPNPNHPLWQQLGGRE